MARTTALRFLLPGLLLGCAPDVVEAGADWLELPSDALGRIDLDRLGRVRLAPDGRVVADGDGAPHRPTLWSSSPHPRALTLDVVDATADRARVRVETGGFALSLWVDRQDALLWTLDPVGASMGGVPDVVRFDPGVALAPVDRRPGARLIRIDRRGLVLEAWVAEDAIDQVRDVAPTKATPRRPDGRARWLQVPTALDARPDGGWFGEILPTGPDQDPTLDDDPIAVTVLASRGDRVRVAGTHVGLRWRAWVDAERLGPAPTSLSGWGMGGGGWFACGGQHADGRIPAGTLLHDDLDGAVIGEALHDIRIRQDDLDGPWLDGWYAYEVATDWGPVRIWLDPSAVELR